MNCDDAFDALTDRDRRRDPALAWHLDLCPRCRQMRDVLEPALELFRPAEEPAASPPAASSAEPFLSPEAVQIAERAAAVSRDAESSLAVLRERGVAPRNDKPSRRGPVLLRYSAVGVTGACLALATSALFLPQPDRDPLPVSPASRQTRCVWQDKERLTQDERSQARAVALSCVACHLQEPIRPGDRDRLPLDPPSPNLRSQIKFGPAEQLILLEMNNCDISTPLEILSYCSCRDDKGSTGLA